jgi:hypothetical protein
MRRTTRRIFSFDLAAFSSEGTSEISRLRSGWNIAQNDFQVPKGRRTFSAVLSGQNFLRTIFQPLCGWLISGGRSATQLALATIIIFFAVGATAETTNGLSGAEIQGRALAQKILEQQPAEKFTNTGVLQIRVPNEATTNYPVEFETIPGNTNLQMIYTVSYVHYDNSNNYGLEREIITITHAQGQPNQYKDIFDFSYGRKYRGRIITGGPMGFQTHILSDREKMMPFAGSDFSIADLGLEFFHWPEQKVLKKEVHRSRGCTVLESTNPDPSTNGYSRVVSWIDDESLGIVEAYAYDAKGKLLKDFYPKDFKKVDGQWQVQTLIMENVQTGSRSRLEFDLKK